MKLGSSSAYDSESDELNAIKVDYPVVPKHTAYYPPSDPLVVLDLAFVVRKDRLGDLPLGEFAINRNGPSGQQYDDLVGPGGRERTEQEYGTLLGKAGLRLTRVVPTESAVSVVEARLD